MHRKSAYILFLAVLALLVIGIVMLFSTSAFARDSHGDVYFFIKRQAIWVGIGLVLCIFAALIDYHFWQRTWWLWFVLALVALALCYVPHIGMRLNGSRRWVGWGPVTFQPSELGKLAAIFFSPPGLRDMKNRTATCSLDWFFHSRSQACRLALCWANRSGDNGFDRTTAFVVMFVAGANPLWLGAVLVRQLQALFSLSLHKSPSEWDGSPLFFTQRISKKTLGCSRCRR